jgi:hypothetical protein
MPEPISGSVFPVKYQLDRGYCGRIVQTIVVAIAMTGTKAPLSADERSVAGLPNRTRAWSNRLVA